MIGFEDILRWKGYPIGEAKAVIREFDLLSPVEREKWVDSKRKAIVTYHLLNNPFYRGFCRHQSPDDWSSLAILKKIDLQRSLGDLITPAFNKNNIYFGNTSGSSGQPFFFAKDKFTHALVWAFILAKYRRLGITSESRQARFYGIPLQGLSYYSELIKDFFMNRNRFVVFDLSDEMLAVFLNRFRKSGFEYLYGYTNSMVLFARYLQRKKITLKEVCPTINLCIATSEMCTEEDRDFMSRVFGVPVVREYGASELDVIAIEDKQHRWALNESNLFIEVVDDQNKPLPYGEEGRLIVTSLFNKAMPFIRYDVGDLGTIERDEQGLYLKRLAGRTNDTIYLPSGKKSPGFTFYYISRNILESSGVLREFIIRQTSIDTVEFDVVSYAPLSENDIEEIKKIMDKYLEPGLKLKINQVERILRPASGKIKHFYSELPQ